MTQLSFNCFKRSHYKCPVSCCIHAFGQTMEELLIKTLFPGEKMEQDSNSDYDHYGSKVPASETDTTARWIVYSTMEHDVIQNESNNHVFTIDENEPVNICCCVIRSFLFNDDFGNRHCVLPLFVIKMSRKDLYDSHIIPSDFSIVQQNLTLEVLKPLIDLFDIKKQPGESTNEFYLRICPVLLKATGSLSRLGGQIPRDVTSLYKSGKSLAEMIIGTKQIHFFNGPLDCALPSGSVSMVLELFLSSMKNKYEQVHNDSKFSLQTEIFMLKSSLPGFIPSLEEMQRLEKDHWRTLTFIHRHFVHFCVWYIKNRSKFYKRSNDVLNKCIEQFFWLGASVHKIIKELLAAKDSKADYFNKYVEPAYIPYKCSIDCTHCYHNIETALKKLKYDLEKKSKTFNLKNYFQEKLGNLSSCNPEEVLAAKILRYSVNGIMHHCHVINLDNTGIPRTNMRYESKEENMIYFRAIWQKHFCNKKNVDRPCSANFSQQWNDFVMSRGPFYAIKHDESSIAQDNNEFFPIVSKPLFQDSKHWLFKLTSAEDWHPSGKYHAHVLNVNDELRKKLSNNILKVFLELGKRISDETNGAVSRTDVISVCLHNIMTNIHGKKCMPIDIYEKEMTAPCHLRASESLSVFQLLFDIDLDASFFKHHKDISNKIMFVFASELRRCVLTLVYMHISHLKNKMYEEKDLAEYIRNSTHAKNCHVYMYRSFRETCLPHKESDENKENELPPKERGFIKVEDQIITAVQSPQPIRSLRIAVELPPNVIFESGKALLSYKELLFSLLETGDIQRDDTTNITGTLPQIGARIGDGLGLEKMIDLQPFTGTSLKN